MLRRMSLSGGDRRWLVLGATLGLVQALVSGLAFLGSGLDNADDAWTIVLWGDWRPFVDEISVPRDTYILQALVGVTTNQVFGPGRLSLAMAVVTLNVAGLWLTMFWLSRVAGRLHMDQGRRLRVVGLAALSYILMSDVWIALSARLNHRTVEVGLLLVLGYAVVVAAEGSNRRQQILAALAVGGACLNDAMVIYVGVLPALALLAGRWVFERSTPVEHRSIGILSGGLVAYGALVEVFGVAGAHITGYAPPQFVDVAEVPTRVARTFDFALVVLGDSVSGQRLDDVGGLASVGRVGITLFVLIALWHQRGNLEPRVRSVLVPVGTVAAGTLLAATLAEIGAFDGQNPRYVTPLVGSFAAAVLIVVATARRRAQVVVTTLVGVACAMTIVDIGPRLIDAIEGDVPQTELSANQEVVRELEERGLEVGFGPYFTSIPLAYWGGDDLVVSTSTCRRGVFEPGDFSTSDAFEAEAERSFIIQPVVPLGRSGDVCSAEQLDAQFGPPENVERIVVPGLGQSPELELRVYAGNIGAQATARE